MTSQPRIHHVLSKATAAMALPYLIIDGYNLMHAAGLARRQYATGDLERCRNRLVRMIAENLSADALRQTTVVFDAFTSESDKNRQQAFGELLIVFAPKGRDADGVIEEMLLKHSVPKRVLVVSSDHRLHKAASRRRSQCIDSEDFWETISTNSDFTVTSEQPLRQSQSKKTPAEIGQDELNMWLAEFSKPAEIKDDSNSDQSFSQQYLREIEDELHDQN